MTLPVLELSLPNCVKGWSALPADVLISRFNPYCMATLYEDSIKKLSSWLMDTTMTTKTKSGVEPLQLHKGPKKLMLDKAKASIKKLHHISKHKDRGACYHGYPCTRPSPTTRLAPHPRWCRQTTRMRQGDPLQQVPCPPCQETQTECKWTRNRGRHQTKGGVANRSDWEYGLPDPKSLAKQGKKKSGPASLPTCPKCTSRRTNSSSWTMPRTLRQLHTRNHRHPSHPPVRTELPSNPCHGSG